MSTAAAAIAYESAAAYGARFLRTRRSAALAGLVAAGALRIHVRAAFPLARPADAHRALESGRGAGKVVVVAGPQGAE